MRKKLTYRKNIDGTKLKKCSNNTGFYRDGYCMTGVLDIGKHTVCAKMNKQFMDFTKNKGNDLYSVVKPGDNWCLCQDRWLEAYNNNVAPKVIREATNMRTKNHIINKINNKKGGSNRLPKLRIISKKNKRHKYSLKDPHKKRIKAINEGIRTESKKTNRTIKQAAISKKARFNVLRIYRKNKKPDECRKLTQDMKYIDKKYKLGNTKNICKKKKKSKKQLK